MTKKSLASQADVHKLYEASVQNPTEAVAFINRMYRRRNGHAPRLFMEDFCGTATLSCSWVRAHPENHAWGVDIDRPTLDWCRAHNLPALGDQADRLHLICEDVTRVREPSVDVRGAFNFSYFIFKSRPQLRAYFETVCRSLRPGGLFLCDLFGGHAAMQTTIEERKVAASRHADGSRVPAFTYQWEHAHFNVINHDITCHIHFAFRDGSRISKAFTYNWRLWTLPELRELLIEAGFDETGVYIHGWTPEGESDDTYRLRTRYENEDGWLAYIAGWKRRD
ncbi:MAG: class I SAM-dependent methyltransferase [Spartobacteria bacterium]|nr:class I SAM-dependent methyltransferase [Spartobacteria bacterium]